VNGTVHDDNAYVMGGVAGHAGLFACAADLNVFVRMILDSIRGQDSLFPRKIMGAFVTRQTTPGSSWALGWDTPSELSSSGRFFSKRAFGHLGYTGTSIWIDPEMDLAVILLTNRVHPSSRNTQIRAFRPTLHDLVYQEIVGEGTT